MPQKRDFGAIKKTHLMVIIVQISFIHRKCHFLQYCCNTAASAWSKYADAAQQCNMHKLGDTV